MLETSALCTIRELELISPGDSVCAAVSGGPDSMSLLYFLTVNRDILGIGEIFACHFNHNIRGPESDRDEEFVKKYCTENGIKLYTGSGHMDSLTILPGESTESMARRLRYSFFENIHKETGALIAIAHNMNDSAETALFNIIRGTGINGVKGISAKRDFYIRPFIKVTRSEILEYCSKNNIGYVTDSTNSSNEYSRNMLRNEVFPHLTGINSRAVENISRLSDDAGEIYSLIENMASELKIRSQAGDNVFRIELLKSASPPVLRQFISGQLKHFGLDVNRSCIDSVFSLISGKQQEYNTGGLSVFRYDGKLYFTDNKSPSETTSELNEGINFVNGYQFTVELGYNTPCDFSNTIDYGKISGKLFLRTRRPGDCFKSAVRGNTKSLKKIFQELRIPAQFRDCYLFLCDSIGIVWIQGFGVCDRVKTSAETKKYIHIKYN